MLATEPSAGGRDPHELGATPTRRFLPKHLKHLLHQTIWSRLNAGHTGPHQVTIGHFNRISPLSIMNSSPKLRRRLKLTRRSWWRPCSPMNFRRLRTLCRLRVLTDQRLLGGLELSEMLTIWDKRTKILASPPSLFRSIK